MPLIRVTGGDWGNVDPREIEALLGVVTNLLMAHFPGRTLEPIIVSPAQDGPVVLYRRGPANEYLVLLSARDRRWAEYVYEFSHELFHILANYEYHAPPRLAHHQWFEETLCESASLYALKHLSRTWEEAAPRPEWIPYGQQLKRFTALALNERHRHLPHDKSFVQWFQENAPFLYGNPYLREKNELVANLLLPLLEQTADWSALAYLNMDSSRRETSFRNHLTNWYANTPAHQRDLVATAMRLFHFEPPITNDVRHYAQIEQQAPAIQGGAEAGVAGVTRHQSDSTAEAR